VKTKQFNPEKFNEKYLQVFCFRNGSWEQFGYEKKLEQKK